MKDYSEALLYNVLRGVLSIIIVQWEELKRIFCLIQSVRHSLEPNLFSFQFSLTYLTVSISKTGIKIHGYAQPGR